VPVIVVNGSDAARGQLFTLLREYAHLLLHAGLCDTVTDLCWSIHGGCCVSRVAGSMLAGRARGLLARIDGAQASEEADHKLEEADHKLTV